MIDEWRNGEMMRMDLNIKKRGGLRVKYLKGKVSLGAKGPQERG
jgi:hypothetical protein